MAAERHVTLTDTETVGWIAKAQERIRPLLPAIIAAGGYSKAVTAYAVGGPAQAPYGAFMLSWPEDVADGVVLHHLRDGDFFLRILARCYAPVFEQQPQLASCLADGTRLEIALTNDVLQVQAAGPPGPYSMVRHHALVLHAATHWLEEPARTNWLALYECLAESLMADRRSPPSPSELADAEAVAFSDFRLLAEASADPEGAEELFADPAALSNVIRYQTYATVAIGVLERDYMSSVPAQRSGWLSRQLESAYIRDDYLLDAWSTLLT